MKQNIANALDDTDTLYGRVFNWVITALILISVVAFTLETLPDLPLWMMETLKWIEVTTVALFTIEYVLRIWTSQRPLQYIFSFYGLVDLLAIIPFYLPTSLDLRTIRALRLLRLFKLLRFTKAVNRFRRAFGDIREELMVFGITSMITLYLASVGIYFCESEAQPDKFGSVLDCMWWSVATLTTVGYGDVYPITTPGKIFTFFVLIVGVAVVSVPSGLLASALSKQKG